MWLTCFQITRVVAKSSSTCFVLAPPPFPLILPNFLRHASAIKVKLRAHCLPHLLWVKCEFMICAYHCILFKCTHSAFRNWVVHEQLTVHGWTVQMHFTEFKDRYSSSHFILNERTMQQWMCRELQSLGPKWKHMVMDKLHFNFICVAQNDDKSCLQVFIV